MIERKIRNNKPKILIVTSVVTLLLVAVISFIHLVVNENISSAANKEDWQAGNIIDDVIFTDSNSMSVQEIQSFLDKNIGECDIWGTGRASEFGYNGTRAQYAASRGWAAPPYTCLNKYYEVPKISAGGGMPANNYSTPTSIPAGAQSAAWIIKDAANRYSISPKVLLVKIATESAGPLTSDKWPLFSQYRYAMGAQCPDSGPGGSANCNEAYAGFSIQMYEAAALMRAYLTNMDKSWWTYKKPNQVNSVLWNVAPRGCGASDVFIQNKATAALYTYTPYQPNQAALNNLYGTGDNCSAYGNRNFWRVFVDWFGSTTGPEHSWSLGNVHVFADSSHTQQVRTNGNELFLNPGQKIYVQVTAKNQGRSTWKKGQTRLGTFNPVDYSSSFADTSWMAPFRINSFAENSVAPSQTGTFNFTITAPQKYGFYTEKYNLLTEGVTWFNDANLRLYLTVQKSDTQQQASAQKVLDTASPVFKSGDTVVSGDKHSVLKLQTGGNLELYTNFSNRWSTKTNGNKDSKLVLQSDGNLVLYTASNTPVWSSGTHGTAASKLVLQSDGNLVLYTASNTPVWSSGTSMQDQTGLVSRTLSSGLTLHPGQSLTTPERSYSLTYQLDGNIVIHTSSGKALWSTNTYRSSLGNLVMQSDGNLVLTNKSGTVIWSSGTGTKGRSNLLLQQDGNLVLYNTAGHPTWATGTMGKK